MRYSILFFLVVSFCYILVCQDLPPTQNPVTRAVFNQAQQFSTSYAYSILPLNGTLVIFFTPDAENNLIKFGIMGGENLYAAIGFNPYYAGMLGGTAAICGDGKVELYNLNSYDDPSQNTLCSNQSNIQDVTISEIDNFIFAEFTWVLRDPYYWPINSTTYVLWSTRQGSDPLIKKHDSKGFFGPFNYLQGLNDQKPATFVDCGYGNSGNYFPFFGDPNENCTCPPSFTLESHCTLSHLPHNHTFRTQSGEMIATMYWDVSDSQDTIEVVVQSTADISTGWTGIAFSDLAGDMGPADAIIFPNATGHVQPLYLPQPGEYSSDAKISISDGNMFKGNFSNFFGFSRNLSGGAVAITNLQAVPMIAATVSSAWPTPHNLEQCSDGADVVNLLTGQVTPGPFVWTKFVTHGFLMWLSWGIIIPCGFLWARFIKGYPNDKSALWFEGHRTLMSIGFILVMVSGVYAIGLVTVHLDSTHKYLGVTVIACALYQVMSAVMRPHADPTNPSPQRIVFEWTHHFIGRATIIISWVTICYGLMLVHGISMSLVWGHVALSVIWLVASFVLEIRKAIITRRLREYESLNRR